MAKQEEQHPGQAHAQRLPKALGQGVSRQSLLRGQGLKQHQKYGVEHGAAQHFQQQVQATEKSQLTTL